MRKLINMEIINCDQYDFLVRQDYDFKYLIDYYGKLEIPKCKDLFEFIVEQIVGQMLSKKVSDRIFENLKEQCGTINPEFLIKINDEIYKKCGISSKKMSYIKEFSESIIKKSIDLNKLSYDENFNINYLTRVKGIGKWTAEMICLFGIGMPDILSYDDVALRNGIIKVKKFKSLSKKRFDSLKKKYSPYSSYAALYFY